MLDRYQRAAKVWEGQFTNKGFMNDMVIAHWIEDSESLFYVRQTKKGREFRLVNAQESTNICAFDHQALASSLSSLLGRVFDADNLSDLEDVTMSVNPLQMHFKTADKYWTFDNKAAVCVEVDPPQEFVVFDGYDPRMGVETKYTQAGLTSPDGKKALFTRDYNLWICDLATGIEEALTTDGAEDNAYAFFAGSVLDPAVQAIWSPDSSRIFTLQFDSRNLGGRPTIHYVPDDGSLPPKMDFVKGMAYPGDEVIETNRLLIIEVASKKQVPVDYEQIPLIPYGFSFFSSLSRQYGWWSSDGSKAYFVATTRGCRQARLIELIPDTGAIRILYEETSDTFVRLANFCEETPLFLPLPQTDECLWFSERSGYGHLYLYDLKTGEMKQQVTCGDWLVRDAIDYCPERRELILQTMGRDKAISPYYKDICKVNIDTGELTELITGDCDHYIHQRYDMASFRCAVFGGAGYRGFNGSSPKGDYIVLTRSRIDTVPESIVIDRNGREILSLETCDITDLPDDWNWPIQTKTKAADGETDIYGAVFLPPGYSNEKSYPVIEYSGSARYVMHTPLGAFGNSHCVHSQYYLAPISWASLGFVVVTLEGRGTSGRNKAFSDHRWGDPAGANDLNDRVAGIKQLATIYPGMDVERVGIFGPEGDTNIIFAPIDHSDFFKASVICFFSDPRLGYPLYSETFGGVAVPGEQAPNVRHAVDCVNTLKGKLLLIDGLRNAGGATFRLTDALEKANKSFDMVLSTRSIQDPTGYIIKRSWDYMVEHLLGEEPPEEFILRTGMELLHERLLADTEKRNATNVA
jgi:dipeptidyl aminopeptidase/acylaminoacyl peptidase